MMEFYPVAIQPAVLYSATLLWPNFDGGLLSSDDGILVLRRVEQRLGARNR
jgi:hypothetical protein